MSKALRMLQCIALVVAILCANGSVVADRMAFEHPSGVSIGLPAGWEATPGNAHAPNQPEDMVSFGTRPNHHELTLVVLERSDLAAEEVATNVETRYYGDPDAWEWQEQLASDVLGWRTTRTLADGDVLTRESRLCRVSDVTCWLYTQYGQHTDFETVQARRSSLEHAARSLRYTAGVALPEVTDYQAIDWRSADDRAESDVSPSVASFVWPSTGYVGYIYGRPVSYGSKGYHDGVDIITSMPAGNGRGNEIYAAYEGSVDGISADPATGRNYAVRINHSSAGVHTHYLHMADSSSGQSYIDCHIGQTVTSDTRIGWQGDQQYYSWGDCFTHLHFTISTGSTMATDVDPSPYLGYKLNWSDPDHVPDWHYVQRGGSSGGDIPPAPASVSASDNLSEKIHVSWSGVSGATHYDVYRSTSPTDVNENQYRKNGVSGTSWDDYGATVETDYYYRVVACNAEGCSNDEGNWGGPDLGRRTSGSSGGSVSGGPWHASYDDTRTCYDDHSQCGNPIWTQDIAYSGGETLLDKNWGSSSPGGSTPSDNWTGQFRGTFDFEPGRYAFIIDHDDWVRFRIQTDEWQRNDAGSDYIICKDGDGYQMGDDEQLTLWLWEDGGDARIRLRWTTDCSICHPPDAPGNVQATDGDYQDKVRVTWSSVSGADRYEVWRSDTQGGDKHHKYTTADGTSWEDTSITPGETYWYWVKCCADVGCGDFTGDSGYAAAPLVIPSPPTNVQATDGTHVDRVLVTWSMSADATRYMVFRAESSSGTKTLLDIVYSTFYNDYTAVPGRTYTYWVRACTSQVCSNYSASDTGYRGDSQLRDNLEFYDGANYTGDYCTTNYCGVGDFDGWCDNLDNAVSSIRLRDGWSVRVFDASNHQGPCACLNESDADLSDNTFDNGMPLDNDISSYRLYDEDTCPYRPPSPSNVRASQGAYTDKIRVSWDAVPNVITYTVSRAEQEGSPYTSLGLFGHTFVDDVDTRPGTTYYYWVAAYGPGGWGDWCDPVTGYRATAVRPPNDNWIDRGQASWDFPLDTTGATVEGQEPRISDELGTGYNTVWYPLSADNCWYRISSAGSDYDTVIAAYSWAIGNHYPLGYDDDSGPGTTSELVFYTTGPDYVGGFFPEHFVKVASKHPGGGNLWLELEHLGDDHEPNNVSHDATTLVAGQSQSHSIDPTGDHDWFKFQLAERSGISLRTFGDGGGDTVMWLYDSDQQQIGYNDDPMSGQYYAAIERECDDDPLQAGTYYAQVQDYNDNSQIASYGVSLGVTPCGATRTPTPNGPYPYPSPYPQISPTPTATPACKGYLPSIFKQ